MSDSAKVMRVNMLGEFSIYYNGEPIRLENNYSTKAMKALQLLLYRGEQGILRDSLLDTLFSSDSTSDPVNNLKVTLSNLRRLLAKVGLPPEVTVQSHNKRYAFVCPGGIDLDVWEFERLLGKAAASEHEEEQREYLLQAADLYKGDFLPHLSGEDWVLVTAAKYRQQYFGCVQDLAALLGRREEWERLYAIATHAAALHHLEEWQCLRIDCLMKLEQYQKAKEVYDQAVRELEEDFVAKPSAELVKRFQMLSLAGDEKRETVAQLTNQLQEETRGRGAYLLLYWLTDSRNNTLEDNQKIAAAAPKLRSAIQQSLRRGDAFTQHGRDRFLVLLIGTNRENCELVHRRIAQRYKEDAAWGVSIAHALHIAGDSTLDFQDGRFWRASDSTP